MLHKPAKREKALAILARVYICIHSKGLSREYYFAVVLFTVLYKVVLKRISHLSLNE